MTARQGSYVFLGPSLDRVTAQVRFPGVILPPAGRGDIDALLETRPRSIGIVDGRFMQSLAVSPKEVIRAIDAGVIVFGGASMGALRAAECARYGMIGVGRVFAMYANGEIDADDEVAIIYNPDTLVATSEPMVNIRLAMEQALATGCIDAATAVAAERVAKSMYFPDRTYPNVGAVLRDRVKSEQYRRFTAYVQSPNLLDQKRADALALLDTMVSSDKVAGD